MRYFLKAGSDGSTAAMAVTAALKLGREPGCVDVEQKI
jgi:hypothetical protein